MSNYGLMSISEVARFARISRTALIHYDHIGLVTPIARGENNYRYYSHTQVTLTNLINTMQSLGISLKEIGEIKDSRTPEGILALLSRQEELIGGEIEQLERSKKLVGTLQRMLEMSLEAGTDIVEAREEEEEAIFIGPQIDYSGGYTVEEATLDFYKYCESLDPGMDMNYPVWALFREERIKKRDWRWPDRFYFWMPGAPDRKPAGLYAVGFGRGYYGHTDGIYNRILRFIDENGYRICGPSWETYPINEISEPNPDNYLIKASIEIEKA